MIGLARVSYFDQLFRFSYKNDDHNHTESVSESLRYANKTDELLNLWDEKYIFVYFNCKMTRHTSTIR